jgi:hypothetical protein
MGSKGRISPLFKLPEASRHLWLHCTSSLRTVIELELCISLTRLTDHVDRPISSVTLNLPERKYHWSSTSCRGDTAAGTPTGLTPLRLSRGLPPPWRPHCFFFLRPDHSQASVTHFLGYGSDVRLFISRSGSSERKAIGWPYSKRPGSFIRPNWWHHHYRQAIN